MRVFCLSLIFLAFSYSAFSQVLGAPIYNWDFANGIPETFVNASSTGICHWEYRGPNTVPDNTVCSRGSCGFVSEPITSVTASNGFVIFDSNYWDDAGPECGGNLGGGLDPAPQNAWLITEPVSLQGITGAVFTFQQQIRLFSATTKVQISTDGGNTWTDIIVNTGYNSPTAEWKTFNLYSYIGQADVRFKFSFVGMYYHWAIDDITIYQPNQNDMRLTKPRYTQFGNNGIDFPKDMEYDQYPQTMIPAFKFSGVCSNIGGLAQTGVRLSVQVINSQNNIVHTAQTNGVNLNPGAASVQTISTTYTPTTALNDYNITYKITQNQTDQNLVNNNDTLDFSITPHTYARDEGPMEDVYVPIAIYATERLELGNYFEARSSGLKFASIAVAVGTGTAPGTVIQGRVYNYEINELQAATEPYIVNIADINSIGEEKMITLPLTAPITLLKDSIYTVMVGNTDGAQPLRICRSGASPDLTSYLRYPDINGLFFLTKTPVVRMNIFPASANPGCTDPIAMNYNEGADFDDGSCDYPGCTDIEAANYDATANFDDGSCQYFGCTNPSANNYDPLATVDDGSCIIPGCTNLAADNYNPIANIDDGSCIISGCTDPEAANYNPAANLENGSCLYPGCTNPEADNYDPEATVDDGSCIISGCTNPGAANFDPTANTDDGSCILLGCTDPLADNYDPLANTDDGSCIISGCTNPLASNYNPQANTDNGSCTFPGCTDPEADNYNPAASPDDGSCIFSGCTDQDADNYDPQANNDDGSCIYYGCMDAGADNYDPSATVDDGSCIYYGCIDAQANNYDPTANTDDGSCEYSTALMQLSATEGCLPLTVTVTNQTNVQGDGTCFFEASNGETVSTCPDSFDIVFEEAGEYAITYTYTQGGVESQVVSPPIIVHEPPVEPILSKSYGTITCDNCSNGDLNWYADDVIFSTDDQHSISSWNGTTYENGLFRVTETNQWSCTTSSASTLVYQPYFSQNIETGCAPLEVLYENLTDPVEGIHCTLTINDVEEPFDSPFLHTFNDPGIYTSILFAQVGEELFSYSQETHILTAVIPELSIETDGTLVCTNCEGNGTVNWYYNGELIATNVYEIDIETPGQFEVELTSTGGCSGSSILNGIEEISNGYIILYPNPATETIQIRSSGVTDNYEIYDSSGRLVGKNSPRASGFAVDISFLDNGFYTMILENAGEIRSMRFMVMR